MWPKYKNIWMEEENDLPRLLFDRIDGVVQGCLVVFWTDESRVAVFLEQQQIHVLSRDLERIAARTFHGLPRGLHRPAVYVDLGFRSRRQEFTKESKMYSIWFLKYLIVCLSLLPNFLDLLFNLGLRSGTVAELLNRQPKSQVLVAVLFFHVLHQLFDACKIKRMIGIKSFIF